jgi:hypothetical protein
MVQSKKLECLREVKPLDPINLCAKSTLDLVQLLAKIPSPPVGTVRVYRGQTKRYLKDGQDSLIAALHRNKSHTSYDKKWMESAQEAAFTGLLTDQNSVELSEVWLPALLQHYGPGSFFLDVTSDIEVAVWFARNRYFTRRVDIPLRFGKDIAEVSVPLAWYESLTTPTPLEFSPVVYVFDAYQWPGFGNPSHCELVAIMRHSIGQRLLYRARRLEKQAAFLLFADPYAFDGPDLGAELKAIVSLSDDFDSLSADSEMKTRDLFPGPSQDPCYAALLSVPILPGASILRYPHPLEIPYYISFPLASDASINEYAQSTTTASREVNDLISRLHVMHARSDS